MNGLFRSWVVPSTAVLALSIAGCQDKPIVVAEDAGVIDSGPAKPVLGGKLGAAVAAAESAQAPPPSSAGAAGNPPETGIFAPGAANTVHPLNAPAKVELLGEGSEPKIALALHPKDEHKVVVTVSIRQGPQPVLPFIDFGLSFKVEKDKGDKAKDDKGKGDSAKAGMVSVIATVTSAAPGKEQGGQLPKEFSEAIAKLKGSEIRYELMPESGIINPTSKLSKDADEGLSLAMKALTETVTLMTVALPQKPVGVGAYWMVTDRSASLGVEVIRYRVFKVEKIEQGRATLALDTRQYAAKAEIDLGAASNGPQPIVKFDSQGKGSIAWTADALLAPNSQIVQRLTAIGSAKGMGVQAEMSAKSSEPEKSDKKK